MDPVNATTRKSRTPKPVESKFAGATLVVAKDAVETLFGVSAEKTYAYAREQLTATAKAGQTAALFGKANLDAALDAGNALVAGAQGIGQLWIALMQGAVDDGIGAARRLAACRTTKDLIDAHGEIARVSYRKFASEGRKLSDLSAKLAGDVSAPIAARVGAAADALAKPFAA